MDTLCPAVRALSGKLASDVVLAPASDADSPIKSIAEPRERGQHPFVGHLSLDFLCSELFGVDNPGGVKLQKEQRWDTMRASVFRDRFVH